MNAIQKEACRAIVNIFETGKVRGEYGAVTVIKGDAGHLSYGRSQVSLGSGNLFRLLDRYCAQPNARFAEELKPLLWRFQAIDVTLDANEEVKALLVRAGKEDPVMRGIQDAFFNQKFMAPACTAAEAFGLTLALAQAVVYDSHVQGGWKILSQRIGNVNARGEQDWVNQYVRMRRDWLNGGKAPLPTTVYRMDSFQALAAGGNWDLKLPFRVHGVMVTEESLMGGEPPVAGETARVLRLTTPYLRGDDVKAVQQVLGVPPDGVYGPYADALVKQWQKAKGIVEDGAGPLTRQSLGLEQAAKAAVQG
jgi:chitosanase